MTKIGVVVGSIREGSFSGRVAKALIGLLPSDYDVTFLEIDQLPLYNQDFDADSPAEYVAFRNETTLEPRFCEPHLTRFPYARTALWKTFLPLRILTPSFSISSVTAKVGSAIFSSLTKTPPC